METQRMDRHCVSCGQELPPGSKLTRQTVLKTEAERNEWPYEQNKGDAVVVDMCLQCQITRAHQARH
jgi:predicted RNA-binding Zn-ribbon protein involved in translation (DUF1610 family)